MGKRGRKPVDGPTPSQLDMLATIARMVGETGVLPSLNDIANAHGCNRSYAGQVLAALQAKGAITGERSPGAPARVERGGRHLVIRLGDATE